MSAKPPISYRTAVLQALLVAPGAPADLSSRISTATGGHLHPHKIHNAVERLLADGHITHGEFVSPSVRAYVLTPEGHCVAERDRAIFLGLARLSVATVGEQSRAPSRKVTCSVCNTAQWLTQRGTVQQHRLSDGSVCSGSHTTPDDVLVSEIKRLHEQSMPQRAIAKKLGLTQRAVSACLNRVGVQPQERGRYPRPNNARSLALRHLAAGPCDLAELSQRIEIELGYRRTIPTLYQAVRKLIDDGLVARVDTSATRAHIFALVDQGCV